MTKALVAVLLGAFCALVGGQPAAAHNTLTGSDPQDGARLAQAPDAVRLTFLSRVDPGTTKVTVTGPDNTPAAAGEPVFDRSRVTVPLHPGPAGLYVVRYEVASGDGHQVRGEIRFTVTVGVTPSATASPTGTVGATSTAVGAAPSPSAVDPSVGVAAPASDTATVWWPWAAGAAVVLAALLTGAALLTRRTRRG